MLLAALRAGRVAHAYLICGANAALRGSFGHGWAAALLCERPAEAGACGRCRACAKVQAGNHPDLLRLEPSVSRAGVSSLRREPLMELLGRVWLRPVEAKRKVAMIDGCEAMTAEAANALLKTLEDPPGAVVFCLLAPDGGSVLPTIASRCQTVLLEPEPAPLDSAAVAAALQLVGALDRMDEHALLQVAAAWDADRAFGTQAIAALNALACEEFRRRAGIPQPDGVAGAAPAWKGWSDSDLVAAAGAAATARAQVERKANFRLVCEVLLLRLRASLLAEHSLTPRESS